MNKFDQDKLNSVKEVTLLDLWKNEMVRRLEEEAISAIRESVRKHAIEVVKSMNIAVQKDLDYRENQLVIKLFGKVSNTEYEEIK